MRWKLINEKNYSRDSLKIRNLKLFHNNVEVNISEWLHQTNTDKNEYLNLLALNIRSLINLGKRMKFANLINSSKFDILFISETWLYEEMFDNELFLPNYSFYRSERKAVSVFNKRGGVNFISKHGGVLIGTKSHFDTTPLVITSAPKGSAVACTLNNHNKKLLLVCFYNLHRTVIIHLFHQSGR